MLSSAHLTLAPMPFGRFKKRLLFFFLFSEEEHCAIYLGKTRYFKAVVTVLVSIQDHTWLSWPQHSGLQRPESNVCFCIFLQFNQVSLVSVK